MTMPASADPAPQAAARPAAPTAGVTVTSLDIPFWNLVVFCFKLAFAAIPALIASFLVIRILFGGVFWLFGGWRYGYWGW